MRFFLFVFTARVDDFWFKTACMSLLHLSANSNQIKLPLNIIEVKAFLNVFFFTSKRTWTLFRLQIKLYSRKKLRWESTVKESILTMPDTENNFFGHFKVSVSELDKTLRPQTLGVCGTCVARVTTRASEKVLVETELSLGGGGSGQFIGAWNYFSSEQWSVNP